MAWRDGADYDESVEAKKVSSHIIPPTRADWLLPENLASRQVQDAHYTYNIHRKRRNIDSTHNFSV